MVCKIMKIEKKKLIKIEWNEENGLSKPKVSIYYLSPQDNVIQRMLNVNRKFAW